MMRFRQAIANDHEAIWRIFAAAIGRLRVAGIDQWQEGYPNPATIAEDIAQGQGWLIEEHDRVVAYGAVICTGEPAYEHISDGQWLSSADDYVVVHRLCVAENVLGMGYGLRFMEKVEAMTGDSVSSFRVDTHADNRAMQQMLRKLGFTPCGSVTIDSRPFLAYEKLLHR